MHLNEIKIINIRWPVENPLPLSPIFQPFDPQMQHSDAPEPAKLHSIPQNAKNKAILHS